MTVIYATLRQVRNSAKSAPSGSSPTVVWTSISCWT
ncbi:hypothetical protein E2C01_064076 [Portunus trituberculatus]|uniref:Uncharacterized protein n=1 Tax=Portunus trituberculatus TaxID=210409 RepID=A0A5B7HJW7_PORTR|nr:hypothetical protein [Portunus trituberculatus]